MASNKDKALKRLGQSVLNAVPTAPEPIKEPTRHTIHICLEKKEVNGKQEVVASIDNSGWGGMVSDKEDIKKDFTDAAALKTYLSKEVDEIFSKLGAKK